MTDDNSKNTAALNDVEFPHPRVDCVAAVEAAHKFIHGQGKATKKEIIDALKPEENHRIGIAAAQALYKVNDPEGYRSWCWQNVIEPGLTALPDVEKPEHETGTWHSINKIYRKIIEELSPPDGRAVSSATIVENVDADSNEISNAIGDLLRFGELEFVNTSGSNMHVRVRLHRPVENQRNQTLLDYGSQSHWLAYIVDGNNPRTRRSRRLFTTRTEAVKHLKMIGGCEKLRPVPELDDVWYEYLGDWNNEYAVLRKEPIFSESDNPWS